MTGTEAREHEAFRPVGRAGITGYWSTPIPSSREMMMTRFARRLGAVTLAAGLAACADSSGPAGTGQVSFSDASKLSSAPAASADTFALSGNTLVITRVQLVLDKIKLKRSGSQVDCEVSASTDCDDLKLL